MDLHTKIKRTNKALTSAIDDEVVMFDADAGKYYGLNSVATAVWNLLDDPKTVDEICDQLITEFEIEKKQCLTEVLEFLPDLKKKGLIEIVDSDDS
jgi:hypothetical protein